jgi:hypothetical protein
MHFGEISLQAPKPSMHGITLPSGSRFQRLIEVVNAEEVYTR